MTTKWVNQELIVNEVKLTDGSSVFDVVGYDRNCRITFSAVSEESAHQLVTMINKHAVSFDIHTLVQP